MLLIETGAVNVNSVLFWAWIELKVWDVTTPANLPAQVLQSRGDRDNRRGGEPQV